MVEQFLIMIFVLLKFSEVPAPRFQNPASLLPRGHILMFLASKVKSLALASKSEVLENCPVLGSRTALFFALLKFCGSPKNFFSRSFFFGERLKKFLKTFFLDNTCACVLGPWTLASSIHILGLERALALASDFFVFLTLASSLASWTPPLLNTFKSIVQKCS